MKTKVKIVLFFCLIFYILSSCSLLTGYVTIGPLTYTKINDGKEFKLYYCDKNYSGNISIASEIDSIPVTTIGDNAFSECTGLTGDLKIPDSVTSIGYCAFYQCYGFSGSLTLPHSIETIGDYAFYHCYGFTGSLTLPAFIKLIGDCVFHGCNLTGDLIIPKSVISIGNSAFSSTQFTNIVFPTSLTHIGDFAFRRCWDIDSITFPPNISYIGVEAFLYTGLNQIYCEALIAPILGDADQWLSGAPVHIYPTATGYNQGYWIYFNIIADL